MKLREANPEVDRSYRQQAATFFMKYKNWMKNVDKFDMILQDKGFEWNVPGYYVLRASQIDKQYQDLAIVILASEEYLRKDSSATFGKLKFKGKSYNSIFLPLPYMLSKNIFVHEFIHYLDSIRFKKDFHTSAKSALYLDKGDIERYYLTPEEFNAYFQEGANNIEEHIDELGEVLKNILLSKFDSFVDSFASNPKLRKEKKAEFFDDNFLQSMYLKNTKYKNKFRSRLYQFFTHLRKKYDLQ